MFPEERQQKILSLISEKRSVKVSQLSGLLGISEVTVRRDLEELHQQKRVLRTHGGAIAMYSVANEVSAPELIESHKGLAEKQLIAREAYRYINENDTLLLDSSSTVFELVRLIAEGEKRNLRVITTSLLMVNEFAACEGLRVILAGGEVNYRHNNVEGHIAKEIIKGLRADKCFIGINGIDEKFGYSTPRFEDAETKDLILESGIQSFILADSSKFEKTYLARVNAECDYLICDRRLPDCNYDWLEERTNLVFACGE